MIKIQKSRNAPAQLAAGARLTRWNCASFDSASLCFITGWRSFEFENNIYGHSRVKSALKADQHQKCCYCEIKFLGAAAGDVDHFRPKKVVQQKFGAAK